MTGPDRRIEELGLVLPAPFQTPGGARYPFVWVRCRGNRAYVSGHVALTDSGALAEPRGKLGADLTIEQGVESARRVGLAMLSSLRRELGSLDRITAWLRVFGMVNAAPDFHQIPAVLNGFSHLIVEVFGPERGAHSRAAVGMASLPFGAPVEVEAEVEIE